MEYLYIAGTILLTVYGQIVLKWLIVQLGWTMSDGGLWDKAKCYFSLLFDPFIFSGFVSAFAASVCWTMTKFGWYHNSSGCYIFAI